MMTQWLFPQKSENWPAPVFEKPSHPAVFGFWHRRWSKLWFKHQGLQKCRFGMPEGSKAVHKNEQRQEMVAVGKAIRNLQTSSDTGF